MVQPMFIPHLKLTDQLHCGLPEQRAGRFTAPLLVFTLLVCRFPLLVYWFLHAVLLVLPLPTWVLATPWFSILFVPESSVQLPYISPLKPTSQLFFLHETAFNDTIQLFFA